MAPVVRIPTEDTLKTLQNVLKKHINTKRILKKKEKTIISGEDYQLMRADLNNTHFLQPMDTENTKASIHYIRQKFSKYCDHVHAGRWRTAILTQNCDKGMMMLFLHWICETYLAKKRKRGKRKSVNQYWQDFKMLYRRVNGCFINTNNSDEVVKYINGTLKVKFELDNTSKPKPIAGPDNLLLLLVHHWARDKSVFPTEDNCHNIATIILFQSYTSGRPAEFVHSSKSKTSQDPLSEAEYTNYRNLMDEDNNKSNTSDSSGYNNNDLFDDDDNSADKNTEKRAEQDNTYNSNNMDIIIPVDVDNCYSTEIDKPGEPIRKCKAIYYKDICLWVVQNPKQGERDVFAMEVHLRHHKGVDRKPKPTTFLFRENPLPILCPISHILTHTIRDDVILVNSYTSAEPFFATDLGAQNTKAMKVHWKPEWLKRPLFRSSSSSTVNGWVKSKTDPMTYSNYAFYIDCLGRDTGFEDKLTNYCFHRGTGNTINGAAPDTVHDQVMRQDPFTGVFNRAYLNNCVRFNVQDTFLKSNISDDGLTRVFTHMSIRYNPGAPKGISREIIDPFLTADPEIANLERQFKKSHTQIK